MSNKLKRFQVVNTDASLVGDNTKPTRFSIAVEVSDEKDTVLVAEQYTLINEKGEKTNAYNNYKKGYIKKLNNPNKKRTVGAGIKLIEIKKHDVKRKGKVYKGKNKRLIINHMYNFKDKKNAKQRNAVKDNRKKRKNYKST